MNRKYFYLITASILICAGYLFSENAVTVEKGEFAGTISKNKKEITVQYSGNATSKIKIGTKLYAVTETEGKPVIIELEVTFPMMTLAKVRAVKNSNLLTDNMPVYMKAEIIQIPEQEALPSDNEISVNFRKDFSDSMVSDTVSKTEDDCAETLLPGNFFLKPDFSEQWESWKCSSIKFADKSNNSINLKRIGAPLRSMLGIIEGSFNTAVKNYSKARTADPARLPSSDETEKAIFGDTLIRPDYSTGTIMYNREVLEKAAAMLYPRDGWFGIYPAKQVYRQYALYLRYFARLAVHLDKNKALHSTLTALQKKASKEPVYMKEALTPILRKGGVPEFNMEGKEISWQIASYYTRRESDGTLKVFLKYFWRAFKDFDPEFYSQPDIRAYELKISKMK